MDKERIESIKIMENNIEELYYSIMEKPLRILDIFNNFFGEEKVDMQGYPTMEEFKSWINIEPISTYTTSNISGIDRGDWERFKMFTLTDLPCDKAAIMMSSFKYESFISFLSSLKFNNLFIIVHFPQVRITNEHDRYVDINHLWAKVKILCNGTMNGGFGLNRSEYTMLHMSSDYMHSHVSGINTFNFSEFRNPCLGSGPIRDTINSLNRDFDEDIWNLFCLELGKYVTVESIEGAPYRYLERIGSNTMNIGINSYITYTKPYYYSDSLTTLKLKEFIKYFIDSKGLKFNYMNNSYSIGMPFNEYITLISNSFISWYNDQYNKKFLTKNYDYLVRSGVIQKCIIDKGKIYYSSDVDRLNNYNQYVGKKVCTFKGKDITITITDLDKVNENNYNVILNPQIALFILTNILKVLNYRYGRSKAIHEDDKFGTDVRYL